MKHRIFSAITALSVSAALFCGGNAVYAAEGSSGTLFIQSDPVPKAVTEYAKDMFGTISESDMKYMGLSDEEAKKAVLGAGFCANPVDGYTGIAVCYHFPVLSGGDIAAVLTVNIEYDGEYSFQFGQDAWISALNELNTDHTIPAEIYVSPYAYYAVTDSSAEMLSYSFGTDSDDLSNDMDKAVKDHKKSDKDDIVLAYGEDISGIALSTPDDLKRMKSYGDYVLVCDIDMSDETWRGISGFSGTLDGNGHEISGLTSEYYGLFSSLRSGAVVKDLKLTDVYITSKYNSIGAVAGTIPGSAAVTIDNCFVSGVVASCRTKFGQSSTSYAGSIVGMNNSSSAVISDCYSNAVVASEKYIGGIVGANKGTVKNCGFGGQTVCSYNVFELVERNGEKNDDYKYPYEVGGIAGLNSGKISGCLNFSDRIDVGKYYGGIVGYQLKTGSVTKCVNRSAVPFDDEMTGGLIAGYASKNSAVSDNYSAKPTNATVSNDIGKGKTNSVSYAVSDKNFGKLSSFKRLGTGWSIANSMPVPDSIAEYVTSERLYDIKGDSLVRTSVKYKKLEKLSDDRVKALKEDFIKYKSDVWKDLSADDMAIISYYGTYNGCEVVIMYPMLGIMTDDMQYIEVGGQTITVGSGSFELLLHKDSSFIGIEEAYASGYLSDEDITAIAFYSENYEYRADM
ncbi:MAG: hypothetical protein ACI4XF_02885 [Oscillospiraceae bacterium]